MIMNALQSAFLLVLCYVYIVNGLAVNFVQLVACAVWPLSPNLYRRIDYYLCYWIWSHYSFLASWWSGSELTLYGNPDDVAKMQCEHCLVTMNHKYDIDWIIGYMFCGSYSILGGSKAMVKDVAKYFPVQGWSWYFSEALFVKRDWDRDRARIARGFQRLTEYPDDIPVNFIILCEGTRFTPAKHERSLEYCRQKSIPPLKHHLLPRVKGFLAAVQGVKGKFPALYDLTVACSSTGPKPKLMTLLRGEKLDLQLRFRRYEIKDIPDDEEGCAEWLYMLYREKDAGFDEFVRDGHFGGQQRLRLQRRRTDLAAWVVSAVLSLLPLGAWMAHIVLYGSLFHLATLVIVTTAGILLARHMIALTEAERSSNYGMAVNGKKTN